MDIIILEKEKNKKGDLFNRMIYEVFHALGFEKPHYNIAKAGREIDMILQHRTENRLAVVESKAQERQIGGDDLNKFAGVLGIESGKYEKEGKNVVGYFVSKAGFKASAIEQERERVQNGGKPEIILLGTEEIKRELISGKVLCSLERAVEAVKNVKDNTLVFCEDADLLVCEQGWIWVLYYSHLPRQVKTHFTFVHADGNQLLNSIAYDIINKNSEYWKEFTYIEAPCDEMVQKQEAQEMYFRYLENELGEIQFEGMPTDQEAGAVKVKLENIFVPLRYNFKKEEKWEQTSIKGVLENTSKAAILAKPGGGKSTLIRRIALAYAFPERRIKIEDELPDANWFPVYIRCRDLGENARKSILEIISTIVYRAEIVNYEKAFNELIRERLQEGRVLLLVDGLDEISDERCRINFVEQLQTFIGIYPNIHLLITSRESGYRAVAKTVANYCEKYTIASLNEDEIRSLSRKWHQAISGESIQTQEESEKVCNIIIRDKRIISLAENPLLLTTLLFVKRWIGYIPTKKCQLYEEMIKLLLVTWNASAHDKLDMDETEPQLAFVAYHMSMNGEQKITRDELERCIINARKELPEILGYTKVSPCRFVDQVEERSSLLIQYGMEENDKGKLVPAYEFSHLSFQEYLTAKAVVELWIPMDAGTDIMDILKKVIRKEHWGEIIPLVAVLSRRGNAKQIVEYLIGLCEEVKNKKRSERKFFAKSDVAWLLANCIASEVPMSQELLEDAIILAIEASSYMKDEQHTNVFDTILKSKYGNKYSETIKMRLFDDVEEEYIFAYSKAWIDICYEKNGRKHSLREILKLLESGMHEKRVTGALLMMDYAFYLNRVNKKNKQLDEVFKSIYNLLQEDDIMSIHSAAWCLVWSGYNKADIIPYDMYFDIMDRLISLWKCDEFEYNMSRVISWAVYSLCMPDLQIKEIPGLRECIDRKIECPENEFDKASALSVAILIGYKTKKYVSGQIDERYKKTRFFHDMGIIRKMDLKAVRIKK